MSLDAKANNMSFLSAYARMKSRYNLYMDEDDFIEKAFYIWREIGDIASQEETFHVVLDDDRVISLPQTCERVVSVKVAYGDGKGYKTSSGKYDSAGRTLSYIPDKGAISMSSAARAEDSYVSGEVVDYSISGKSVVISSPAFVGRTIYITFKSVAVDDDGLPMINEKVATAIAATVALQIAEQNAFSNPKDGMQLVQYLKMESDRLMQAAAIPEKMSNNALDKLLNEKVTWNRKVFNKSLF